MLIYGICMSEIKDSEIDWDKVEKLLESYDSSLHGDFKEYVNYDDSETPEEQEYWKKEWFLAYDSMGYHGLGAFLPWYCPGPALVLFGKHKKSDQ